MKTPPNTTKKPLVWGQDVENTDDTFIKATKYFQKNGGIESEIKCYNTISKHERLEDNNKTVFTCFNFTDFVNYIEGFYPEELMQKITEIFLNKKTFTKFIDNFDDSDMGLCVDEYHDFSLIIFMRKHSKNKYFLMQITIEPFALMSETNGVRNIYVRKPKKHTKGQIEEIETKNGGVILVNNFCAICDKWESVYPEKIVKKLRQILNKEQIERACNEGDVMENNEKNKILKFTHECGSEIELAIAHRFLFDYRVQVKWIG